MMKFAILLGCTFVIGGCLSRNNQATMTASSAANNTEHSSNQQTQQQVHPLLNQTQSLISEQSRRVTDLEDKLDQLLMRLQPQGRGAYRNGSGFSMDNVGRISLLQRLHELRDQLTEARAHLQTHQAQLDGKTQELDAARKDIHNLKGELGVMAVHKEGKVIAQQEAAARKARIKDLQTLLHASELQRLRIEKAHYEFVSSFLTLKPLQTQEFLELQRKVRNTVSEIAPQDLMNEQGDVQ